jgi:ParB family chromosome partitioning protein
MSTPIKKKGLGRGLESLMKPASATPPAVEPVAERPTYFQCPVDRIVPMVNQPRVDFDDQRLQELANSIRESGIIQPLVVRQGEGDKLQLIAGERRWRAAQLLRMETVPVVVRETTDADMFVLALVENIQRADLNPLEEAQAYERLLNETGMTHDALADRVGRSRTTITNALRVLRLPASIRELVREGTITSGHARALLMAPEDARLLLAERITHERISVREAEEIAREMVSEAASEPAIDVSASPSSAQEPQQETVAADGDDWSEAPEVPDERAQKKKSDIVPLRPQLRKVQARLAEQFGTRVILQVKRGGSGKVEIHFADQDALRTLVDQLLR